MLSSVLKWDGGGDFGHCPLSFTDSFSVCVHQGLFVSGRMEAILVEFNKSVLKTMTS